MTDSKPHVCPLCSGTGKLVNGQSTACHVPCHGCRGTGIVWSPATPSFAVEHMTDWTGNPSQAQP